MGNTKKAIFHSANRVTINTSILKTLGFLSILLITLAGYPSNNHFLHFDQEDGLATNKIYSMYFGPNGKLWLANESGLSMFDGYGFVNYGNADGLADEDILEIYEDRFGRIWFISFSGRISYYENDRFYKYPYNDTLLAIKHPQPTVYADFEITENGSLHISYPKTGSFYIDSFGMVTRDKPMAINPDTIFHELRQNDDGSYFFIPFFHPKALKKRSQTKTTLKFKDGKQIELISDRKHLKLDYFSVVDRGDSLFVTIAHKLFIIVNQRLVKEIELRRPAVRMQYIDGNLWFGLHRGGLQKLDLKDFHMEDEGLEDLIISGLIPDEEGGIWVSTALNGLYYLSNYKSTYIGKEAGLSYDIVSSIEVKDHKLHAGNYYGFIDVLGPNGSKQYSTHYNPGEIYNILYWGDQLMINSRTKLVVYNGDDWYQPICPSDLRPEQPCLARSFTRDVNGHLISGGIGMILKFSSQGIEEVYRNHDESFRVDAIANIRADEYWVGTATGLRVVRDNRMIDQSYLDPFLKNHIIGLLKFDDSTLVIGTKSFGLGLLNIYTNELHRVSNDLFRHSLKINDVILGNRNDLWIGSGNGLIHIQDPDEKEETKVRYYDEMSGISSLSVNDIRLYDDTLYLATNNGITIVNIKDLQEDIHPPEMYIERIQINQKDTAYIQNYILPYDQNQITISYGAIDFKSASNISYAYRITNLEKKWNMTNERTIAYAGLSPGIYEIEIMAQDAAGMVSPYPLFLKFQIEPPFWQEAWFLSLLVLFILLVIGLGIYSYQLRLQDKAQKKIEEAREKAQLEISQLRSQMNPHFIFNTMNSILYLVDKGDKKNARTYITEFSKLLRKLIETSPLNRISLKQELDFLKTYVRLENLRFEQSFNFKVKVQDDLDLEDVKVPSLMIQPYVENSIVHGLLPAKRKGNISLNIIRENGHLICSIEDNGVGRERAQEIKSKKFNFHKSVAMSNTRKRLNLINEGAEEQVAVKVTDLKSEDGKASGTKVDIRIKLFEQ